jgi:predicted acyl esterase
VSHTLGHLHRGSRGLFALAISSALAIAGLTAADAPFSPHAGAAVTTRAFGSVEAAYLTAPTGTVATLFNSAHHAVGSGTMDSLGALVIHDVTPGKGYHFSLHDKGSITSTPSFTVMSQTQPRSKSFYGSVKIHVGLNYIPMRDGITLAATLRLPVGKTSLRQGPFPTLIEYSGYGTAAPGSLLEAELGTYKGNPALLPDTATIVGSVLAPSLGFAVVSLQMRGTGCSGGAFDLFGPSEPTDGYDAIQEVAAQPWAKGHKVGLVGISYSGISQFAVAGLRPPGLASIAPLSPTDDLYSTGSPGGIANTGFAASWIADRVHDAKPASATEGQPWAWAEIHTGDITCLANQHFHGQAQNVDAILAGSPSRTPSLYDLRSPVKWAPKISVPVFMVGALQDEQTGPQWPALVGALANDKHVYATMQNGTHGDSLDPDVLNRWIAFNDLYVAKAVPKAPGGVPLLFIGGIAGSIGGSVKLPPVPETAAKSYAAALAAFASSEPRVTVNFDNGNSKAGAGRPQSAYSAGFTQFPPATVKARSYFLGAGGSLQLGKPGASSVSFEPDPTLRPATTGAAPGFNAWAAQPNYDWAPVTGASAAGFITAPLTSNMTVVGNASLNVWLRSTASDTDLQVTVSDVRPNGQEFYVTSGFLRASYASTLVGAASSVFDPVYTFSPATRHNLTPNGAAVEIRVPIDPIAYTFRAGSRLRVTIEAPGGDRPSWAFGTTYPVGTTDTITLGPSALVLPTVAGVVPTDGQPACGTNRGEPCRTYVATTNGG